MEKITLFVVLIGLVCTVYCKPMENKETGLQEREAEASAHTIEKRFINTDLTSGGFDQRGYGRIRTKRSEEDCEKLRLCRLHAHSGHSLLASFELYFVNKENARLWDHKKHSIHDCNSRYSCDYNY